MFDFKNDKSWFVILVLLFAFMPIGIMALIGKIIYTIYKSQNAGGDVFGSSNDSYERTSSSQWSQHNLEDSLHEIEDELKDSFETWKETSAVSGPSDQGRDHKLDTYDSKGFPVELSQESNNYMDILVNDYSPTDELEQEEIEIDLGDESMTAQERLSVEHLENELNTEIDLTFNDVHIDTEITFDETPEDHGHEGEAPLKTITCTMCGTENKIYVIDRFETPTCEKCGMLLLDRS